MEARFDQSLAGLDRAGHALADAPVCLEHDASRGRVLAVAILQRTLGVLESVLIHVDCLFRPTPAQSLLLPTTLQNFWKTSAAPAAMRANPANWLKPRGSFR